MQVETPRLRGPKPQDAPKTLIQLFHACHTSQIVPETAEIHARLVKHLLHLVHRRLLPFSSKPSRLRAFPLNNLHPPKEQIFLPHSSQLILERHDLIPMFRALLLHRDILIRNTPNQPAIRIRVHKHRRPKLVQLHTIPPAVPINHLLRLRHSLVVQIPILVHKQVSRLPRALGRNRRDDLVAHRIVVSHPGIALQLLTPGPVAAADDNLSVSYADSAAPEQRAEDEVHGPVEELRDEEVVDEDCAGALEDYLHELKPSCLGVVDAERTLGAEHDR